MSKIGRGFYSTFLLALAESEGVETDDVALVRGRLVRAITERPADVRQLMQGTGLLVRAAASERRMSGREKGRLRDSITSLLEGLGEQLLPGGG